jgi:hypothetical protein
MMIDEQAKLSPHVLELQLCLSDRGNPWEEFWALSSQECLKVQEINVNIVLAYLDCYNKNAMNR